MTRADVSRALQAGPGSQAGCEGPADVEVSAGDVFTAGDAGRRQTRYVVVAVLDRTIVFDSGLRLVVVSGP